MYLDKEFTQTDSVPNTSNPDFNHHKVFSFHPVTQQLLEYLKEDSVTIQVMGKQLSKRPYRKAATRVPKQLFQEELLTQTNQMMDGFKMNGREIEPNQQSIIVELLLMKKQQARQQQRIVCPSSFPCVPGTLYASLSCTTELFATPLAQRDCCLTPYLDKGMD